MTYICLGIDKISNIQDKNLLTYQEMILNMDLNRITQKMSDITAEHSGDDDYDPDTDADMRELQYQQQIYDSEKEAIETQLKELSGMIDSEGKALDQNVKSETTFKISGG